MDPKLGNWNEPGSGPYNGKQAKQRNRREVEEEKSFVEFGKEVTQIKEQLELLKKPKGQKDNPSRFCKDLLQCSPGLKNGESSCLA